MENQITELSKTEKLLAFLGRPTVKVSILCLAMLTINQGLFADEAEMITAAGSIKDTLFSSWIRKSVLAFGGIGGIIQSIFGGSFKPLLVWGGLGLSFTFIPKLIDYIAGMA
ncbi:MAG: hypothetical protein P0S95_07730 [Rhabdochlamydiaceae bacterium]|nr:hypothetical protein [Candidatus Amphrikana amoebophyrae]